MAIISIDYQKIDQLSKNKMTFYNFSYFIKSDVKFIIKALLRANVTFGEKCIDTSKAGLKVKDQMVIISIDYYKLFFIIIQATLN